MYSILLAGGSGTRFWPRSREQFPKQLLSITGSGTLIQNTVERLLPLVPIDKTFVITNESHAEETCRQLSRFGFSASQLLAEPVARNTAAAIGFIARLLQEESPDEVMAIYPADHVIQDADNFRQIVRQAESAAQKGHLVTLGIEPTGPETGYGYIKKGSALEGPAFKVDRFVEKPDAEKARRLLKEGGYLWNSGMFFWKVSALLEEMQQHLPELEARLGDLVSHISKNQGKFTYRVLDSGGRRIFESLPSISIDHGLMEKSNRTAVIPANIRWNDVGAWNSLEDVKGKDTDGNVLDKNVIAVDTTASIIQSDRRLIATLGVNDLIIIDTEDALLICKKDRAQDVKTLVNTIKKSGRSEADTHPTVLKPWGSYTNLEARDNYLVKRIEVSPGEKLSLQSHVHRSEHWTVVSGTAEVQKDQEILILSPNQSVIIPKGAKHRLSNPGSETLVIIEVQIGDKLDENDITRHEDLYGRS